MAKSNTAWGIEIGQYEVKAIQLESTADGVRVVDFWIEKHPDVLTDPKYSAEGLDGGSQGRTALGMTLSQLSTQKRLEGQPVVVSFSWMQNRGFARFTQLLPFSNPKEGPSLVRYEAEQQIPFPLDEVEWDYHLFSTPDAPEYDVGIFAIQREPLEDFLGLLSDKGIVPTAVTLSPIAVYNAIAFDRMLAEKGDAVVIVDIGTSATDLIIADGSRCWMRTFPLGGHDFTEAISNEYKKSYSDSEVLKQNKEGDLSVAKALIQAYRQVLSDLVGDVEKSVGFYQSRNKSTRLKSVIGLGSTMKISGLRKVLGTKLNEMVMERFDSFQRLTIDGVKPVAAKKPGSAAGEEAGTGKGGAAVKEASGSKPEGIGKEDDAVRFSEHTMSFTVAYGLALQGLEQATVDINLLPAARLRSQIWQRKQRWFAAAAGLAVAAGGLMFVRGMLDNASIGDVSAKSAADAQVASAKRFESDLAQQGNSVGARSKNMLALLEDREVWPFIVNDAIRAVASGNTPSGLSDKLEDLTRADPERRQMLLRDLSGVYKFAGGKRVIEVTLDVESNAGDSPADHFARTVGNWLQENARRDGVPYQIEKVKWTYSKMKVGADGGLSAEASSSGSASANTPTDSAGGVEGGNFSAPGGSFTAGGDGAGGNNFGGLSGKRQAGQGGTLNRPGGRLGGAGAGGGFTAPGGDDLPAASGDQKFSRRQAEEEGAQSADLDKLAPIPGRPALYPKDSSVYVGKVTFEVVLSGEVAAPAAAEAPLEGQ